MLCFIILYWDLFYSRIISPWELGFKDNDLDCKTEIIKCIKLKMLDFECTCFTESFYTGNNIILILDDENTCKIFKQVSKSELEFLDSCSVEKRAQKLVTLVASFPKKGKNYLNYCLTKKKIDQSTKIILISETNMFFHKIKVFDSSCTSKNSKGSLIVKILGPRICQCSWKFICGKLSTRVYKWIVCNLKCQSLYPNEFISKITKSMTMDEAIKYFIRFNRMYCTRKFFFSFFEQLLQNQPFGAYLDLYLSISNKLDLIDIPMNISEVCNRIKNINFEKISVNEMSIYKKFFNFALYQLFFDMSKVHEKSFTDTGLSLKVKKDLNDLIDEISTNIKARIEKHRNIIKLLWSKRTLNSIVLNEFSSTEKAIFNDYIVEIHEILKGVRHLSSAIYIIK